MLVHSATCRTNNNIHVTGSQIAFTQYTVVQYTSTTSPCFTPFCFTLFFFCCKIPYHFTHVFNLRSRIFGVAPFTWFLAFKSFFSEENIFYLRPLFQERNWGVKQGLGVCSLYNVLYTVSTQQYIITVIKYIQSGHITATCFDRKRSSSGQ